MVSEKIPTHLTFFDLDQTLLTVNSGFKFGLFLFKERILPLNRLFYLIVYYFRFKLGLISPKEINEKAIILFLNRVPLSILEKYVKKFLDETLDGSINPKIFNCLVESQKRGDDTVILSSSPDFLVREISKRLGVKVWGATEYTVDGSGFISAIKTHMGGEDKAVYLNRLCERLNIDPKNTTVYTDSIFDLPFLQAAGVPIAVNPDKKLRQLSLAKNWQIL